MENPRWSYDNMVREAYRVINWNKKIDECSEVEDLELRLKACDHDNNFYFDCGIAVSNVVNDIYMNGNWYRDQDDRILRCIGRKLKKIWAIIRNKEYYYSDVLMSRDDFEKYKEYVNQF